MSLSYCYLPTETPCVFEEDEPYIVHTSRGPIRIPALPPLESMDTIDQARYLLAQSVKRNPDLAELLLDARDIGMITRIIAACIDEGVFPLRESAMRRSSCE